ncbi:MAG: hypothetical protein V4558_14605 [Gemmatimonadota bacterium]
MRRLLLHTSLALTAILLCPGTVSAQVVRASQCAPIAPHDGYAVALRKNVIRHLNAPTQSEATFKFSGARPADTSVKILTSDSLCSRAAIAMQAYRPESWAQTASSDSTSYDQVFVISIGSNRFVAEGINLRGVSRAYVLDSTLTTVLTFWEQIRIDHRWELFASRQLPFLTIMSWGPSGIAPPDLTRCATPTDYEGHLGNQLEWLTHLVGDSTEHSFLRGLSLPFMRDPQVSIISDHSLCKLAAKTINRDSKLPQSAPHVIFLLRIGINRFWAETDDLSAGEWGLGFILDGTLRRVLARAMI